MANEITVQIYGTLVNGNLRETFNNGPLQFTQTTAGSYSSTVVVGTAEEVILTGDIATLGYLFLINLDATNYVRVGPQSLGAMVPLLRIYPGMPGGMPLEPGVVIRAQANTADVRLKILIFER